MTEGPAVWTVWREDQRSPVCRLDLDWRGAISFRLLRGFVKNERRADAHHRSAEVFVFKGHPACTPKVPVSIYISFFYRLLKLGLLVS